mgnify:CR=1 FL=1
MKKYIWINYDFGLKGDYEGLFIWLDKLNAKECGNNCALVIIEDYQKEKDVGEFIYDQIKTNVNLDDKKDRIYINWLEGKSNGMTSEPKIKGKFVFGKRKRAPWEGYAAGVDEIEDSGY